MALWCRRVVLAVGFLIPLGQSGQEVPASPPDAVQGRPSATDRYGDRLPGHAAARLGTVRFRVAGQATSLRFSPSGTYLISSTAPGNLFQVWEAATGKPVCQVEAPIVLFAADGKTLISIRAGSIVMRDLRTGKEVRKPMGPPQSPAAAHLSADGRRIAAGGASSTRIWDLAAGKEVAKLPGLLLDLSSSGMVLTGREDEVFQWQLATSKEIGQYEGQAAAFSPADGNVVVASQDTCTVRLVESATGKTLWRVPGEEFEFSGDGRWLRIEGGADEECRIVDARTGKKVLRLPGPCLLSPRGDLAAVLEEDTSLLWDLRAKKPLRRIQTGGYAISCGAFAPDGETLALSCGRNPVTGATPRDTIRLFDVATAKERRSLPAHESYVYGIAVSPRGDLIASGGEDGTIRMWELRTGKLLRVNGARHAAQSNVAIRETMNHRAPFPTLSPILALRFSTDGKTLTSTHANQTVCWWDVPTGKRLDSLTIPGGSTTTLTLSRDAKWLAAGSSEGGTIRLWDVAGQEVIREFGGEEGVLCLSFSPDGKLLAVGNTDATIRLWEASTGKLLHRLENAGGGDGLAFSPDGRLLAATGAKRTVRVWDVATGKERSRFALEKACNSTLAFSPDSKRLAWGDGELVRIGDLKTGALDHRFAGHTAWVSAVAFAPDGRALVSASWDTTCLVWALDSE
jgi:WD40 repeat protein